MNQPNPGSPAANMPANTISPALFPAIQPSAALGYCRDCGREHDLGEGGARQHCLELIGLLKNHRNIDLFSTFPGQDPRLATDSLFGEARGKMFGVMECLARNGDQVLLRAFSGQFNGIWEVPGWAPPLFASQEMMEISYEVEKEIKRLGREMVLPDCSSARQRELQQQRRGLSQELMRQIHGLYRLSNFRGRDATLFSASIGQNGLPTGIGDCCAPKLFNLAARQNLMPLGITEFYWGRGNRSASRQHGHFYPSCREKCAPILGFMLCGLEELHAEYRQ